MKTRNTSPVSSGRGQIALGLSLSLVLVVGGIAFAGKHNRVGALVQSGLDGVCSSAECVLDGALEVGHTLVSVCTNPERLAQVVGLTLTASTDD